MAYSKIAATPDGSSSYFLPRLIGLRRAMELYFTNRVLTAREALEWGLVTRVGARRRAQGARSTALARELAQGPSKAFGVAKRLLPPVDVGEPGDADGAGGPGASPPAAAPRTSGPASPRSPQKADADVPRAAEPGRAGILASAEGAMKPRLYYRPG